MMSLLDKIHQQLNSAVPTLAVTLVCSQTPAYCTGSTGRGGTGGLVE